MAKWCDFCFRKAEHEVKVFGAGWAYVCYIHFYMHENDVSVVPI